MMNENTTIDVDAYVERFDAIKERVGDDKVAAVILEQIAKDQRTERIAATRNGNNSANSWNRPNGNNADEANGEPATQKQQDYLKDLGVKVPKGLSKQEASQLIEEATTQ